MLSAHRETAVGALYTEMNHGHHDRTECSAR